MSSESRVRISAVESLRFPGEGSSAQGKSGAKVRPQGIADAQQVKIPALNLFLKTNCDMVRKGNQGRGKTWLARGSEKYSNEVPRLYWREK